MKPNATAIANYFVDLAKRDDFNLMQLGLMKRVYIAHGFHLAFFDASAIDPRFDTVEAWKNGPVIPSVYHSFKYNRDSPIKDKAVITRIQGAAVSYEEPILKCEKIMAVADMVWERYRTFGDFDLVKLTHKSGTPWALCYEEGKSNDIPDLYTKAYYKKLIKG